MEKRRHNWRSALYAAVTAASSRPFAWGSADCVTFAADCIIAQTGRDPIADIRGRYTTPAGALRVIRDMGAPSLLELVRQRMPAVERGPAFASEGDLALIETAEGGVGWACGLFLGARIGVLAPTGYATIERRQANYAFKV